MSAGRLPDALIAGVPKAGTSALARWLGDRADVHLPPDKEVHYFDEHAEEDLDWYRSHYAGVDEDTLALDATPTYVLRDDWFASLAETLPSARVVVVLRHPVDRLWSAYWYLRYLGFEPRSLRDAVDEELGGRARYPYAHVASGYYDEVLDRLDRHYPGDRSLVLLHDDLTSAPEATYDRVCDFLGIDRRRPEGFGGQVNVTGTLRSYRLRYWTLRLKLYQVVPPVARLVDGWNRTERRPPPLPDDLRNRLLAVYEPRIVEVERRLGRELPAWRR